MAATAVLRTMASSAGLQKKGADIGKALRHCEAGEKLLKCGRRGKPKFREFWLDHDFSGIWWQTDKKTKRDKILVSEMKQLVFGQRTAKFERNTNKDLEHLSFSIIYENDELQTPNQQDTLDLIAKDEKSFSMWTAAIGALLDKTTNIQDVLSAEPTGRRGQLDRREDGQEETNDVYAWGYNEWGQLATVDLTKRDSPELIKSMLGKGVKGIAVGWSHVAMLLDTNAIMQVGSRIGTGHKQDLLHPRPIQFPADTIITNIACGHFHSTALSDNGELYAWGCNFHGQLGLGHHVDMAAPQVIRKLADKNIPIVDVECGAASTVALSLRGQVYTWGSGAFGQLGHNGTDDEREPRLVADLKAEQVTMIAAGDAHMVVVTERQAYSWGWNACGQLGTGSQLDQHRPVALDISKSFRGGKVFELACGAAHTCAIVAPAKRMASPIKDESKAAEVYGNRAFYVWGSNAAGQLGLPPHKKDVLKPTLVTHALVDHDLIAVAAGALHTVLLASDGEVLVAGANTSGQLGIPDEKRDVRNFEFQPNTVLSSKGVRRVACGGHSTTVLVPRQWVDDKEAKDCMKCHGIFTTFNRKHHCRKCYGIFCSKCSSKKTPILSLGLLEPQRVCDGCYKQLYDLKFATSL